MVSWRHMTNIAPRRRPPETCHPISDFRSGGACRYHLRAMIFWNKQPSNKQSLVNTFRLAFGGFLILLALLFPAAHDCSAQDSYTRIELGTEFSTVRETPYGGGGKNFPGFGGRFDWNFNRRLALEGQVDFFPGHAEPIFLEQGGQTLEAVFGLRAKVIQTKRLSVFGLIRPGLIRFSDVLSFNTNPDGSFATKPSTNFVLNLGGGLEYYISPRWVLRADISGNPNRVANENYTGPLGSGFAVGKVDDTTRLSFGVAYRPGVLIENELEHSVSGNWEVGPLFTTLVSLREGSQNGVRTDLGLGGYASRRIWGAFYADGDVLYFPANRSPGGPHDGGELLQGLFGIKGGIRRNHVGFFGKVRPGFNSYSQAVNSYDNSSGTPIYGYGRSTNFVLDLGGIVEFYPTERSTLRIEAGDTHVYYGTRNVDIDGVPTPYPGGALTHSIEFMVGYGWRF
jgi:Outer membrane protein beta-barrel domain